MKNPSSGRCTRREATRSLLVFGGAALFPSWALLGCKHDLSCEDVSGITPEEQAGRSALAYTDKSLEPGKNCTNCKNFKPGPEGQCGACVNVKGPINPVGYCKGWITKA